MLSVNRILGIGLGYYYEDPGVSCSFSASLFTLKPHCYDARSIIESILRLGLFRGLGSWILRDMIQLPIIR
jgi:hypothetical protein